MSKPLVVAGLLAILLSSTTDGWSYPEDAEGAAVLFRLWKNEYEKSYRNADTEQYRFQQFQNNLLYINKLNKMYQGKTTFQANHFSDMSVEEFKKKILMSGNRRTPVFSEDRYIRRAVHDPLPDSFDWTDKLVTPVKDQGSLADAIILCANSNCYSDIKELGSAGTCWAFSAIGNIEGQWMKMGKPMTNLSVEQVVDCDGKEDVKGGHADCGVFGGWPYLAYQYIQGTGGLQTWEDYWYCCGLGGAKGTCEVCPAPGYNTSLCGPPIPYCKMTQSCVTKLNKKNFVSGLNVIGWKAIDQNETVIASQLMELGPLSVALDATLLQFYHHGVFEPFLCNPKNLDHAVLLVGFGQEKELFETKYYWKVKNSWGHKWGEKGYFRIKRGAGMCGINTQVTSAVLQKT